MEIQKKIALSPMHNLMRTQDAILKELIKCHNAKPMQGILKSDGAFEMIEQPLTETEQASMSELESLANALRAGLQDTDKK